MSNFFCKRTHNLWSVGQCYMNRLFLSNSKEVWKPSIKFFFYIFSLYHTYVSIFHYKWSLGINEDHKWQGHKRRKIESINGVITCTSTFLLLKFCVYRYKWVCHVIYLVCVPVCMHEGHRKTTSITILLLWDKIKY